MGEIELREEVTAPYSTVRRALLFSPEELLAGGQRDPTTLFEAAIGDVQVAVRVKVDVGAFSEVTEPAASCTRRFDIAAEAHPGWYPILSGALQADDDGVGTGISLGGTYRPPGGPLGRALDAAGLHDVAQASLEHYFDELLQRIAAL